MNPLRLLQVHIGQALASLVDDPTPYVAMVKPSTDPKHGDYQANCAMALAKALGKKPPDVARDIVDRLDAGAMLEPPEIAGPGFINLRLKASWLAEQVRAMALDPRLGVAAVASPRTFVIDFSSPNVAKPMHVGHLRSTIIGDALTHILRYLGHHVITDNHLGDWGTQFGILLHGYKNYRDDKALAEDPVREMTRLYVHVRSLMKAKEDEDDTAGDPIADAARRETALLHAGDPENFALWQKFMPWCLEEIDRVYRRLDIRFDHTLGESYYQPMLAEIVAELEKHGIAQRSDGAVVIFYGEKEPPALIQKKDGAFTYTTTDLATLRHRIQSWHCDAILYVVDARQALHFKNLFDAVRRWGYHQMELSHVSFGSVCGPDRKPIKTREGGAIELGSLLDEAEERALQVYQQTCRDRAERGQEVPELSREELAELKRIIGIGAVKYADLSQNRTSDYIFSWDKMLAMDGNTATYMQYAYVRNRGIFRKGQEDPCRFREQPPPVLLQQPQERNLAVQLLRFEEAVNSAAAEYKVNLITAYLWDLAKAYSTFNDACHVLNAESPELRESRLLLCDVTARVIQQGLALLGIKTIERM